MVIGVALAVTEVFLTCYISKGNPVNGIRYGLGGNILDSESIKKLQYLNEIFISYNSFSGVGNGCQYRCVIKNRVRIDNFYIDTLLCEVSPEISYLVFGTLLELFLGDIIRNWQS